MSKYRLLEQQEYQIRDDFWDKYTKLVKNQVIPYQWEILNDRREDAEPSHAIDNFRIAAGEKEGSFYGQVFQDSDVYKWLEAVGNILQLERDPKLEKNADAVIEVLSAAQCRNGYLNTYFQIMEPEKKWTDLLECHELYCAGHLIEGAIAYYTATGKEKILQVATKLADHIDEMFGEEEGKLHGYPGHQEIEIALLRLYDTTSEARYLKLASYFLETRGTNQYFEKEFEKRDRISFWTKSREVEPNKRYSQFPYTYYNQFHLPVRKQEVAVGHAVRGVYMYTAMADLAAKTNDQELFQSCDRIWNNIVSRQMYITGGIGSTPSGEAFTVDYDLPNDTVYAETCASIGLIFFGQKMLLNRVDRIYSDAIERALYNLVLAGMSVSGDRFFYVNPLEVVPESCEGNPERNHVKPTRQKWFACACCPPNIARLIGSLWKYVYTADENTVYIHQYIAGSAKVSLSDGTMEINTDTQYPWDGTINIQLSSDSSKSCQAAIRIPAWCTKWSVLRNGVDIQPILESDGYIFLKIEAGEECRLQLNLDLTPKKMCANPKVHYNAGKIAVTRGPLIYCAEETDNGKYLNRYTLKNSQLTEVTCSDDRIGEYIQITASAMQEEADETQLSQLYSEYTGRVRETDMTLVPYFLWNNRGDGEMTVWIRQE